MTIGHIVIGEFIMERIYCTLERHSNRGSDLFRIRSESIKLTRSIAETKSTCDSPPAVSAYSLMVFKMMRFREMANLGSSDQKPWPVKLIT